MTDFVRVKQKGTGHELSLPVEHVEAAGDDAYQVFKTKQAVDEGGTPLPPKYHTSVDQKAAEKSGQSADRKEES